MITIIMTGGTIDSFYDPDSCTVIPYGKSIIPAYIKDTVAMDNINIEYKQICMKDSRGIDEHDRKQMVEAIEQSNNSSFVITHGTYTMFETAQYIKKHLTKKNVTVTITGSLIPLLGFSPTDAGFGLAIAISNSMQANNGVYVAIKGAIYDADNNITLHSEA